MPSVRHETAFVIAGGGRTCISSLWDSWVMYLERRVRRVRGKRAEYRLLKYLALCCLRIAEVHHLVHELVDDDKVIPDALLLEFLKVFDEDLDETVEEEDGFCGI
jgi:hypothetical protein